MFGFVGFQRSLATGVIGIEVAKNDAAIHSV